MKRKDVGDYVTAAFFVETWQRAKTIEEVCEKVGAKRSAVLTRMRKYRSYGVRLKTLVKPSFARRGRPGVPVEELNAIVDRIESGGKSARR